MYPPSRNAFRLMEVSELPENREAGREVRRWLEAGLERKSKRLANLLGFTKALELNVEPAILESPRRGT